MTTTTATVHTTAATAAAAHTRDNRGLLAGSRSGR